MMFDDLQDLLWRIESATEGSRELDAAVCAAFKHVQDPPPDQLAVDPTFEVGSDDVSVDMLIVIDGEQHRVARRPPFPVTTSIDAAVALIGRRVRGCSLRITMGPSGHDVDLTWRPDEGGAESTATAASADPPLALCSALLRAEIAKRDAGVKAADTARRL